MGQCVPNGRMNVRKYTGAMTIGWLYVNCLLSDREKNATTF